MLSEKSRDLDYSLRGRENPGGSVPRKLELWKIREGREK